MKLKRVYKIYKLSEFTVGIVSNNIFTEVRLGLFSVRTWRMVQLPNGVTATFKSEELKK